MSAEVKPEQFEGPLDLLLQLIEQEKLNITEVSLSKITEEFLAQLDHLGESRSEELADFLVIATRLVYLKSRNLLPHLYAEEEYGPSLADQLKMYKQYVEASKHISARWQAARVSYGRVEPPVKASGFILPPNAGAEDIYNSFLALAKRLQPINPLPQATIDRTISIKQRVEAIFNALKQHKKIKFADLLCNAGNRTDVIISFLALLELIKDAKVTFSQGNAFEEMMINKV